MNKCLIDSNAPPQIRGIPNWFARGAPVVAKKQPIAHDRQLTHFRDGPNNKLAVYSLSLQLNGTWLMAHGSKHNWNWNAPPDAEIISVQPCVVRVFSAVKERTNRKVRSKFAKNAKDEKELNSLKGESIRGKPFTLYDNKISRDQEVRQ